MLDGEAVAKDVDRCRDLLAPRLQTETALVTVSLLHIRWIVTRYLLILVR